MLPHRIRDDTLAKIYADHHTLNRERGFSIMKEERGKLLKALVGRDKTVLDIGCRDGALTRYFTEGNEVLGVDVDTQALKETSGIRTKGMDLNGGWSELGTEKFDVVVAGEVLEHLYFPEKVVAKIADRLVERGLFVGSVPNAFSLKNRLRYLVGRKDHSPLSDPTHITQFHIDELRQMLENHFSDVEVRGLGRYKRLSSLLPGLFAFDLLFTGRRLDNAKRLA